MKGLVAKLALLVFALLLSASLAEVTLRVLYGRPVHFRYPQPRYVSDPAIGHWMEPGQRAFNHDEPLSINSVGIRGDDYPREPPPGTRRVLALGDSQTFGNGLKDADTWPALLERELSQKPGGMRWEVINGGLSGTDTWQHERMLERLARAYDFDVVVLGFYVNDVTGIYSAGDPQKRTNTLRMRAAYVAKRSALFTFLSQSYRRTFSNRWQTDREQSILTGAYHTGVERGWKQVEVSLAAIKAHTIERGAGLLLLVIPRSDQVTAVEPSHAYNERITEIASRLGIPVVDVLAPLRDAHSNGAADLFIPWDGHNTGRANAVIARELAPHVRKLKSPLRNAEGS